MVPIIKNFLKVCRADKRDMYIQYCPIKFVQCCRTFASVIIAHCHDNSDFFTAAGHIGMTHHFTATINTWTLSVSKPHNAFKATFTAQFGLLSPPERSGCQIFVGTFLKSYICLRKGIACTLHVKFYCPKRQATITCHIPCCIPSYFKMARFLC